MDLKLPELIQLVEKLQKELKIDPNSHIQSQNVEKTSVDATNLQKKEEKVDVNIILQKIDPNNKAKLIREIKSILPNLNLVEAKTLVESAPKVLKEKVKSDEAKAIKSVLESLGAQIVLE